MGIDAKGFNKGLGAARKDLNAFAGDVTRIGIGLAAIGAVGAIAIGKVVVASSNLEEQTDRTRDQFGKFADQVIDQSKLLGTAFGLSRKDVLESASVLSAIFESAGYAGKGVADLSVHFVKLATDLSRFANIPFHEALRKIESGLVGQVRPLREVGVSMSDDILKAYAYKHAIAVLGSELTDSQKIQSRAGFIAEALQKSWGNLAKTGDKVAGAIEGVKGRFENLSATIGDSLLMVAAPGLMEIQLGLQSLQKYWIETGDKAVQSSLNTSDSLGYMLTHIFTLRNAIKLIGDAWQFAEIAFKSFNIVLGSGILQTIKGLKAINDSYIAVANLFPGKKIQSNGALEQEEEIAAGFVAKQFADLKELQKQPWAHATVDAAFGEAKKEIDAARKKLGAQGKLDVLSIKPGIDPGAITGKEHKGFAHAAEFGSAEAVNAILASTYGSPKLGGAAEKTAENTGKTNILLEQILKRGGGARQVNAAAALLDAF